MSKKSTFSNTRGVNRSADFMKTAGGEKPYFIKCGFGGGALCGEVAMRGKVAW